MYYETNNEGILVICGKYNANEYHRLRVNLTVYDNNQGGYPAPVGYVESCGIPTPNYPHPHPGIPLVGGTAPLQQPETQN